MLKKLLNLTLLIALFAQFGCAISRNVVPVNPGTKIEKIYVMENDKVHMEGLIDEIIKEIKEMGFESESYSGQRPVDAKHYLTFTANWSWDMAMYLTYFRATLYEEGKVLGEVEYDSRMGGASLKKFGKTANKVRPLMEELLAKVENPSKELATPIGN